MKPRFTPNDFVTYVCGGKNREFCGPDEASILVTSWDYGFTDSFSQRINAVRSAHWPYRSLPLFTGSMNGKRCAVIRARVGAPAMIMHIEELAAWCGIKTVFAVGFAGSLQKTSPIGSVIIPRSCISEEGTSRHYWNGEMTADSALASALEKSCLSAGLQVTSGKHWTTDAPYMELDTRIEAYAEQGVLGVDMETSAMYALGHARNIRICNLLVVTDELWSGWNPAFKDPRVVDTVKRLEDVVFEVATGTA